ncbi:MULTISPECIES: type II toxin-antitoxin system RelE/ParE family toxin [Campylobacter]|uniref:type II toxin-antitoxin system RelE/ParE family toxin n=1 Tax=Campylobacter TaxID=194 RepID=UPI00027A3905|nr:type II toxin-antitoxin system RelE/ParE family toxin [Campylobacter sp. FOBRC14]EJP75188.1 plasmid stabilization system protein, RelE/ParE family [Campylobacter sp. FOBRC14]
MVIKRTQRFDKELKAVFDYIAKDSHARAQSFTNRLLDTAQLLSDNPSLGRKISDDKRELIIKGYVIPYAIIGEAIYLLGIYNANEWQA